MQHAFLKELRGNWTHRTRFNDGDGKSKVNEFESLHIYYQTALCSPLRMFQFGEQTSIQNSLLFTPRPCRTRPLACPTGPRSSVGCRSPSRLGVEEAAGRRARGRPTFNKGTLVSVRTNRPLAPSLCPLQPFTPKARGQGHEDGTKLVSPWLGRLPLEDSLNLPCFPNSCSGWRKHSHN